MAHQKPSTPTAASVFDVRHVIALLFALFGVVLTLVGLFATTPADLDKAAGVNVNLWSGVLMLVFAVLMSLWGLLRPVKVPTDDSGSDDS